MMPLRNISNQNQKRKSREGDWICIHCSNYNYSFRNSCNRCQIQTKLENDKAISLLGKQNYGEKSFPSALFLPLAFQIYRQNIPLTNYKERYQEVLGNAWIHNLINE